MPRLIGLLGPAVVTMVLLCPDGGVALASHVRCGDVITADTTLDSDLTGCTRHGIVIGADNIAIDLAGHTIQGPISSVISNFGVANNGGHDGVSVGNGTITGFYEGVRLTGAAANRFHHLTIGGQNQAVAIKFFDGDRNVFDSNTLSGNSAGITGTRAQGNAIDRNSITGAANFGILLEDARDNRIVENSIAQSHGFATVESRSGIALFAGGGVADGNVVESNSISGSYAGIRLAGATGNRIARNVVGAGYYPVHVSGGSGNRIERNSMAGNSYTISLFDSHENSLVGNRAIGNSFGIQLWGANSNRVMRNWVGKTAPGGGFGVEVSKGHRNVIAGNRLWGHQEDAVRMGRASQNRVVGNVIRDSDRGIGLYGADANEIARNDLTGGDGILVRGVDNLVTANVVRRALLGLFVQGAARNVIAENLLTRNGVGMLLQDDNDENIVRRNLVTRNAGGGIQMTNRFWVAGEPVSETNLLAENTSSFNGGDGFFVQSESTTGTRLERNVAHGNADDGIEVAAPATTLLDNLARRNGDLGIEAVAGVTDAGGNRAFANGDPLQCLNVRCR